MEGILQLFIEMSDFYRDVEFLANFVIISNNFIGFSAKVFFFFLLILFNFGILGPFTYKYLF